MSILTKEHKEQILKFAKSHQQTKIDHTQMFSPVYVNPLQFGKVFVTRNHKKQSELFMSFDGSAHLKELVCVGYVPHNRRDHAENEARRIAQEIESIFSVNNEYKTAYINSLRR